MDEIEEILMQLTVNSIYDTSAAIVEWDIGTAMVRRGLYNYVLSAPSVSDEQYGIEQNSASRPHPG